MMKTQQTYVKNLQKQKCHQNSHFCHTSNAFSSFSSKIVSKSPKVIDLRISYPNWSQSLGNDSLAPKSKIDWTEFEFALPFFFF